VRLPAGCLIPVACCLTFPTFLGRLPLACATPAARKAQWFGGTALTSRNFQKKKKITYNLKQFVCFSSAHQLLFQKPLSVSRLNGVDGGERSVSLQDNILLYLSGLPRAAGGPKVVYTDLLLCRAQFADGTRLVDKCLLWDVS
jgi:hypothetical protein